MNNFFECDVIHRGAARAPIPGGEICLYAAPMELDTNKFANIEFDPNRDPEILMMMRKIYPALSEEELREAKENLESYLKLAWRIAVRLEREAEAQAFDNAPNNSYDTGTKVEQTS